MNRTLWCWIARPDYKARHATTLDEVAEARRPGGDAAVISGCGLRIPTGRYMGRKHTEAPVKLCERCRQVVWEAASLADFAANAA